MSFYKTLHTQKNPLKHGMTYQMTIPCFSEKTSNQNYKWFIRVFSKKLEQPNRHFISLYIITNVEDAFWNMVGTLFRSFFSWNSHFIKAVLLKWRHPPLGLYYKGDYVHTSHDMIQYDTIVVLHIYISMYIYIYVYIYTYVCVCDNLCLYLICIWTDIRTTWVYRWGDIVTVFLLRLNHWQRVAN